MCHQVLYLSCAILAVCCLQIQAISLERLNTNVSPASSVSELEQILASMNVESGRHSKNETHSSDTLSLIISGLLSGFTTAITPALGPLGPLVTIGAPLANNAITGLITHTLTSLLHRAYLSGGQHEYERLVNFPNQKSYYLMANKPEPDISATLAQQLQIKNLFNNQQPAMNQFTGLQNLLRSNGLMPEQQSAFEDSSQQTNNLIVVPLGQMNGLNGINGINGIHRFLTQQQGRSRSDVDDS